MYEIVIVGAGLAGSVMARELAEAGKEVLVLEKRDHIAGNVYDEYMNGVLVQKYGPHFLTTYSWEIIEYLGQFTDFYPYPVKAKSFVDGRYVDRPYNFRTLQQLVGPENSQELLTKLRESFPNARRVTLSQLTEHDDALINKYGKLLYDTLFVPYVAKQWGLTVEEISPDVINRTTIALGYDAQIDDEDYQYLPSQGFTEMVRKMLDHPKITVQLKTDAVSDISFDKDEVLFRREKIPALFYTGQIDELFSYRYGELPYRSRHFTNETSYGDAVLPCEVVTYPKEQDYLRRTEFRWFNPVMDKNANVTVVQSEYSLPMDKMAEIGNEPYYPVLNDDTVSQHRKYISLSKEYKNLFLCGRLADFRYYDMDKVIQRTFEVFQELSNYLNQWDNQQ